MTTWASSSTALRRPLPFAARNTKEGLMVSVGLAGTDKHGKVLLEYEDVKALRSMPGKGLVGFALKAFR